MQEGFLDVGMIGPGQPDLQNLKAKSLDSMSGGRRWEDWGVYRVNRHERCYLPGLERLLSGLGKLKTHSYSCAVRGANRTSCSILEVIYSVQLKMGAQELLDSGNLQSTNLRPIPAPSRALQRPSPLCNDDLFVSTPEWGRRPARPSAYEPDCLLQAANASSLEDPSYN